MVVACCISDLLANSKALDPTDFLSWSLDSLRSDDSPEPCVCPFIKSLNNVSSVSKGVVLPALLAVAISGSGLTTGVNGFVVDCRARWLVAEGGLVGVLLIGKTFVRPNGRTPKVDRGSVLMYFRGGSPDTVFLAGWPFSAVDAILDCLLAVNSGFRAENDKAPFVLEVRDDVIVDNASRVCRDIKGPFRDNVDVDTDGAPLSTPDPNNGPDMENKLLFVWRMCALWFLPALDSPVLGLDPGARGIIEICC